MKKRKIVPQSGVILRFYGELNDFLPSDQRQVDISVPTDPSVSVKHLIESMGVPHTEVDLILINGEFAGFDASVQPGDRISVYPVFESLNIQEISRLRPQPLRIIRFVADGHLGRLAAYLRLLGFDTLYDHNADDPDLASISRTEKRILLTRDRGLLMRNEVTHGYFVHSIRPMEQIKEVIHRFDLWEALQPFRRCLRCNGILIPVEKSDVLDRIPERSSQYYTEFHQCPDCGGIYWKGSHYRRMQDIILQIQLGKPRD